jgi:hypothetical protein
MRGKYQGKYLCLQKLTIFLHTFFQYSSKNLILYLRSESNSKAALQRAKMTLETEYSVVGVLERLEDSLKVMEAYVPAFLKGITRAYRKESELKLCNLLK